MLMYTGHHDRTPNLEFVQGVQVVLLLGMLKVNFHIAGTK